MQMINDLPYPGGLLLRLIRRLLTGKAPYAIPEVSKEAVGDGELVVATRGVTRDPVWTSLFDELIALPHIWVYLHGSQADRTTTAFSDYDDLVIVDMTDLTKSKLKRLVRAMNRVDMRFCRLDPLQHHGHWIISKQSLSSYDESFLPLLVLEEALAIHGPSQLTYTLDRAATQRGLVRNVEATSASILAMYEKYRTNAINAYTLKGLVGSFALMPAFIFQLRGEGINKRTAIERASELYSEEALRCIAWSTHCRNNWAQVVNHPAHQALRIAANLFSNPHLYRRFAQRSPNLDLRKLTFPELKEASVRSFVNESRRYLDAAS